MIGVKTGKFEFADVGQLVVCGGVQSYIAGKGRDNPTTGLLFCKKRTGNKHSMLWSPTVSSMPIGRKADDCSV